MRAARQHVAAHAQVLRGGEEREGTGGGAGQEGAPVQTTGESRSLTMTVSLSNVLADKRYFIHFHLH